MSASDDIRAAMALRRGGRSTLFVCGLAREAAIAVGAGGAEAVVSGADPRLLAQQLAAIAPATLGLVVSFGLAGGLDEALPAGALLLGSAIVSAEGVFPCDPAIGAMLSRLCPHAAVGLVAGRDAPLLDVAAKRACRRATAAMAVDMESHVAARFADRAGVPFVVVRAVSDPADRALPALARVALGADGRLAPGPIAASLLAHPGQILALPRLARDSGRAFAALAQARRLLSPVFD